MKKLALYLILFSQLHAQPADMAVDAKIKLATIWLEENLNYYHIPGLAIAVTSGDKILWSNGFGVKSLETNEKMTDQTMFRIASISKLFTSTAILQLRDKGYLHLDDPVVKYLPWFEPKNPYPDAPIVTIRHLLTHTSGLPRESEFPYWTNSDFPTREELIEMLPKQTMIYAPETKYKYSNLGMAVLGEIIASVSSMTYSDYINVHLLDPLGLKNTKVTLTENERHSLATGYMRFRFGYPREIAPFTDSKALTAAANLSSTVIDLARFSIFHYDWMNTDYNAILKSSTRQEMLRPNWLKASWESARGLGFSVSKSEDGLRVGHGGWVDGYRSQLLFDPQNKVAVIVMMNTEDFSPYSIAKLILKIWSSWQPEKGKASDHMMNPTKLTGQYFDTSHWQTDVVQLGESLYLYDYSYPPGSDPSTSLKILVPESDNRFILSGPRGNGEPVTFLMAETGEVGKIKIGANYIYPVSHFNNKDNN